MTDDAKTPAPARPRRSAAGGLALLLSLIALIGLAYLWYMLRVQDRVLGINVAQRLDTIQQAHSANGRKLTAITAKQAALAASQTATAKAIAHLRKDVRQLGTASQQARGFRIREAKDLLLMANDRLRFDHNVPLALGALQEADHALARAQDPRLLPVRQAIADEMVQLRGLAHDHIQSMAMQLLALANEVDQLPLNIPNHYAPAATSKPKAVPRNFWVRAWDGLRHDILRLVRIRKEAVHERVLLAPRHQYFLRENLKLQLYAAELALLEHHPGVANANIATADRWVRQYFATHHTAVSAFLTELSALRAQTARIKWPSLDRALDLLRQITAQS